MDENVQMDESELIVNMVINTPSAKEDHVQVILKWEKDPRSAVTALAKIAAREDVILGLFGAAQDMVDGTTEWDDDASEDGDE